jgi:hypothetical protein
MHYLLNKNLSLEEKGIMSLMLHLQEGGIRLTSHTIKHYCEQPLDDSIWHLYKLKYLKLAKDGGHIDVSLVREDNEIKE